MKIPTYTPQVPIRSGAIPTTGLQPERAMTAIPEAVAGLGQAIGQIGDAIFKRELKHREEDIDTYLDDALLKEQTIDLQHLQKIKTTAGSDRLQAIVDYQNEKKERKDPSDPNSIDTSTYYGKRAKQYITDTHRKKYELKKLQFDNTLDMKIAVLGSEARKDNATQIKANVSVSIAEQLSQGLIPYKEAVRLITEDTRTELSQEENVILNHNNIRTMTGSYLDSRLDADDAVIAKAIINKEFDSALVDPTAKDKYLKVNQYRDRATKVLKGINVDTISDKYSNQLKDPFDTDKKQLLEDRIKAENVTREEKQAILAKFRHEVNQKQQDVREGERSAEDKIYAMIENKQSPSKVLKAISLDDKMRPQTRIRLRDIVLKGDGEGGFAKSNPATLASTMLGIQENPDKWEEDNIRELINKGKLHPKDGYALIEDLRKRMKEGPTKANSQLALGLKRVNKMAADNAFISKEELETLSDVEAGNLNSSRHVKISQELQARVRKGEDVSVVIEELTKPYIEEKSKGFLNAFIQTLKGAAMPKARTDAMEVLKRNGLPVTNENVEEVIRRMRGQKK